VAEQELDLFEVVGAEALDTDLLGRLLHHRPDRPVSLKPLLIRPPLRMPFASFAISAICWWRGVWAASGAVSMSRRANSLYRG
jgi:hypothetical protein